MNILKEFTIKNLKLNKKRSIVTIIGIILSTALICTVAGMFYSFDKTMIDEIVASEGDYHVEFYDVKAEDLKYFENNNHVKKYYLEKQLGFFEGKNNMILEVYEYDQNNLNTLKLKSGRLPQNSNEIVLNDNGNYKIGDVLPTYIGDFEFNEETEEETITNGITKEYKIVGFLADSCYKYGYISKLEDESETYNIKLTYDNIKKTYKYTEDIKTDYGYSFHRDLLNWNFVMKDDKSMKGLLYFIGIIIGIILVSSVFVIRNSFEISTTEKMRQYGMLASIGATKKQIRKTVLYEGLFLGLIAIPSGILLGYIVIHILVLFTSFMFSGMTSEGFKIAVYIPYQVIVVCIVTGSLTILLSSLKSAYKASKVSPIEAIRNNNEIKIKSKKLKTPKLINKLFGIGGVVAYKNLKRNKKKYRTTVISLVVSITIFISLYSFMNNLISAEKVFYKQMHFNMSVYSYEDNETKLNAYEKIAKLDGIEYYTIVKEKNVDIGDRGVAFHSLNDEAYKKYLKDLNLKYDDVKDKVIYIENTSFIVDGKLHKEFDFKENDTIEYMVNDKTYKVKVAKITETDSYDMSNYGGSRGTFIVSEEYLNNIDADILVDDLNIKAKDAYKLEDNIEQLSIDGIRVSNYDREAKEVNNIFLWISVFLYGFITVISLIGVTNIFNTITTNMNLRSKEFAMLKSVGMTKKEFNNMIRLESVLYGLKSLVIGCTLGVILSRLIYSSIKSTIDFGYHFPTTAIVISIVFISLVIGLIMRYSLKKINKQNIIETIRRDNI